MAGLLEGIADFADDAWDRGFEVGRGAVKGVKAGADFALDLAEAPFTDDEYGGILDTLFSSFTKRGGEAIESTIGPKTGLGAAIGGLPQFARKPANAVIDPALAFFEWAYEEGVSQPITTAITASSLADRPGGGGILGLFRGPNWRKAYKIAQDRSPGQAFALALGTKDILDPDEVEQYAATQAYQIWSSTGDAILRYKFDPSVLAGKGVSLAKGSYLSGAGVRSTALRSVEDIAAAKDSARLATFAEAVQGVVTKAPNTDAAAARIRHQFFPNHADGNVIATVLAQAGDVPTLQRTLGVLMGDQDDLLALTANRADLTHQIRNLTSDASDLAAREAGLLDDAAEYQVLLDELDVLYPEADRIGRLDRAFAVLDEVPRYSRTGEVRARVATSDIYQNNPLTAPLRVVTNMLPSHWLNLNDQRSDVHISRLLRDSDLPQADQDAWRGRYMAAQNTMERQAVAVEAEAAAVRSIMRTHSVPEDAIDDVLANAQKHRQSALGALQNRRYDAERGSSVVRVRDADGGVTEIHLPQLMTQRADLLPLADMREVRHAAEMTKGFGWHSVREAGRPAANAATESMEFFYSIWRPATLLRVGWPVRILMDEQLRVLATIGAMANGMQLVRKGFPELGDRLGSGALRRVPGIRGWAKVQREAVENRSMGRYGPSEYESAGQAVTVPGAFGTKGDSANVFRQLNSANGSFREMVLPDADGLLTELRGTGRWGTVDPGATTYSKAWTDAVNHQLRQDRLAREAIAGRTVDEMVEWFSTEKGVDYARQMNWKPHTFRAHAEDVHSQVYRYMPTSFLRRKALVDDLDYDDLVRSVPDEATRPKVHGEDLAQSIGTSEIKRWAQDKVARLWSALGSTPTDVLSRNPFFDHVYQVEARRLIDITAEQARTAGRTLDNGDLQRIADQARRKALGESQSLLYDLAEKSQFAHIVRFASPFYMAFQEVLTRWTGLAIENPAFVARMRLAWNSPEKAGVITDENGRQVNENGQAWDEVQQQWVKPGKERYVTMPHIPGLPTAGGMRFNKKSLSIALGGPGFGPLVQVPVNEVVKDRPTLEDSVRMILPFGATADTLQLLFPATAKRAFMLAEGDENRIFHNTKQRILFDLMTDYHTGKRDDLPAGLGANEVYKRLYDEASDKAQDLAKVRTVASYVLPFAPIFDSPYQPWINAYRNAQERLRNDPTALGTHQDGTGVTADEWFLERYGEEFFYLTGSLSKSNTGIPPTLEGYREQAKYQDLIEEYPEFGGLVIGNKGAGEYSAFVYAQQLDTAIRPGSDVMQRETPSYEEGSTQPEADLGWMRYSKAMDIIDAERSKRGLPNYNVRGAADLAEAKRQVITQLSEKYPVWFEQFNQQDRSTWGRRLAALRAFAADPRLDKPDRQDMVGLRVYLKARDAFTAELGRRKAKTLTAASNADLAEAWSSVQNQIIDQHIAFAPLFYRWLERDTLEVK